MGIPANIETGSPGGDDPDSWDRTFNIMAPETGSPGELVTLSPKRTHFGSNFARVIVPDGREQTQADVLAASQAIAILESRARSRNLSDKRQLRPREPFFLAVGLVRPHVPSVAPQRLFGHYPDDQIQLPSVPENDLDDIPESAARMRNDVTFGMNDKQQRQAVAAYYSTVEFMDEQVGRLLDALDRLKLRDHTVVIFTSDHGFHLGEHTLWQKNTLFEESTRVPLLISAPGYQDAGGKQSNALVELTDLYPTIVDLTNQQAVAPDNLAGHSLVPILRDPESSTQREFAYTVTGQGGRSIRSQDWRYNVWGDGAEELYDLKNDPKQFTNLANQPSHANTLNLMREALQQRRTMLADGIE
jgi:arylsulfatase A-like enzyme